MDWGGVGSYTKWNGTRSGSAVEHFPKGQKLPQTPSHVEGEVGQSLSLAFTQGKS